MAINRLREIGADIACRELFNDSRVPMAFGGLSFASDFLLVSENL